MTVTAERPATPDWVATDFLTPAFFADPYPFYDRLLAEAPVVWSEQIGAWLVSPFDEVGVGLSDLRLSSGARIPTLATTLSPAARERNAEAIACMARMMSFRDAPDHTRLRRLVSRAFTARRVAGLSDEIEAIVARLVAAFPVGQPFDLRTAFAFPLPAMVICRMLGIDEVHLASVRRWSEAVVTLLSSATMTDAAADAAQAAVLEADAFIAEALTERAKSPRDDLLTALAQARDDGDALTGDEITAMVILLFFAGFETTEGLIGNGARVLMSHPHLRRALADDPARAEPFVEEVLRWDPSIHRQSRVSPVDTVIAGTPIRAGEPILFMIGAAGRDPRRFTDPGVFNPDRADAGNVGFGHGAHFCLGAPLARLESRIALRALAQLPTPLAPAGPVAYGALLAVRKPEAMPVIIPA